MIRIITILFASLVVIPIVIPKVAFADTITLEPDRDNSLYETPSGDLSNGSGSHLFSGRSFQLAGFQTKRALLRFDIAGNIPAGSTILGATLRLNVSKTISGDVEVFLHRALADWGESSSDATGPEGQGDAAQAGDATWTETFFGGGLPWTNPGGDFDSTASASLQVGFNGSYVWGPTAGLTADVQSFLDDDPNNFGWIVIGNEEFQGAAKRFDSRENANAANRPKLVIDYCPASDASWNNYGTGWPGTNGVPSITVNSDPIICQPLTLNIDNSAGQNTQAFMFLGLASAQLPTGLGGDLLLIPSNIVPFFLPGAGVSLPGSVPCDQILCGLSVFLQVLESDAGASAGVSFTPGLELAIGTF